MISRDLKDILDSLRVRPFVTGYKPRTSNYPSAASVQYKDDLGYTITEGGCNRKEWYDWMGFGRQVSSARSARNARILQAGLFYEEMFRNELKEAGLWVGEEIPFYIPEYKLSGRIDAFIKDPALAPPSPQRPLPEHLIGIEFKTVGGYFGCKGPIISTRDTPLQPKASNVLQCLCYLKYYGQFGINKWLLLYVDRALGSSEASPTHWNYHLISIDEEGYPVIANEQSTTTWKHFNIKDIFDRYDSLNKAVNSKTIPDRDYHIQYDNERIIKMYTNGKLSKTDKEAVERAGRNLNKPLNKVTEEDGPLIAKGDWMCRFCDYQEICYSDNPGELPKPKAAPKKKVVAPNPDNEPTDVEGLA